MSEPVVTLDELRAIYDFDAQSARVQAAIERSLSDPWSRIVFFARYTSWNGFFGSGVAAMAGKIGRARGLFRDPVEPVHALADRSVHVASFFFDAARDEFDDRDTVHRDTHRCLAQATLCGLLREAGIDERAAATATLLNTALDEPLWLHALNNHVALGYGVGTPDDAPSIFHAIGYHLGSEVLADREFSVIDATLRAQAPGLVDFLARTRVHIAGEEHSAYQWLHIHSGHGGGAEADHFAWATQGARLALRYTQATAHPHLRREMHAGFARFAQDHRLFFDAVNEDLPASLLSRRR